MLEEIKTPPGQRRLDKVKAKLRVLHPVEVANLLDEMDSTKAAALFRLLSKDIAIDVFDLWMLTKGKSCCRPCRTTRPPTCSMSADDRAELFEKLPVKVVKKHLSLLNPDNRE